jgi:hypothetical protein
LTATRIASFDVVVIGAGAAGMMCAAQAAQRGRRVLLIEHYPIVGEKIRISGGGRCNFTNIHSDATNFLSQNPDFCRPRSPVTGQLFLALLSATASRHEKLVSFFATAPRFKSSPCCGRSARGGSNGSSRAIDRSQCEWRFVPPRPPAPRRWSSPPAV